MVLGLQVVFDCADPDALARFWSVALGYVVQPPPDGFDTWDAFLDTVGYPADERGNASAIVDPDGVRPRIYFQKVPEAKQGKNRVHLDINAGAPRKGAAQDTAGLVDAHVARLEALGARRLQEMRRHGERWVVMADPEGNEFCVQ